MRLGLQETPGLSDFDLRFTGMRREVLATYPRGFLHNDVELTHRDEKQTREGRTPHLASLNTPDITARRFRPILNAAFRGRIIL